MKTEIIINVASHESRIAILEDGRLAEILVERAEKERMVGDVYRGVVTAVLPGLQAGFVDIGQEKSAFLHVSDMPGSPGSMVELDAEILEDIRVQANGQGKFSIDELLSKGQEIIVQIKKESISTKGPRITAVPSLAGRFMVLVPDGDKVGVSRKITNWREKRRLRDIGGNIKPEGFGLIVRTEARDKGERELRRDLKQLLTTWKRLQKQGKKSSGPKLLHKEIGMTSGLIRDLFTEDVHRLFIDSKREYKEIQAYLKGVSPELRQTVEYYGDTRPIFDAFGIEAEIEKLTERKIWFKGGAYLVIDPTEALVAIDVNSGRSVGKGRAKQDETVLKTNLEAAREVARQLRLRDMGGLVVVDFIDMNHARDRKRVEDEMHQGIRRDRSKIRYSRITEFGLMEMTRQRVRPSLMATYSAPCPQCHGTGHIPSQETVLSRIERWLKRSRAAALERRLTVQVHPTLGFYLLENRRERLKAMRKSTRVWLDVESAPDLSEEDYRVFSRKRKIDVTNEVQT